MTDPRSLPKILYIEDNPNARDLVSRVLSSEYIVLEAADALSGIELALDTHPDLILLDMNLPQLSGSELAARLTTLLPDTPLVAFSGDTTSDARRRALAAGCVGYLTKPIDIDQFPLLMREFLNGKRENLPNAAVYQQQFTAELVARLEEKVREVSKTADRNAFLNEQNQHLIAALQRRQRLLETAARVSHIITSILDFDELLRVAVDAICEEYNLYFAAIYLLDPEKKQVTLQAGHGELGMALLAQEYRLPVDDTSPIGKAIVQRAPQVERGVLNLSSTAVLLQSPSELALPLIVKDVVLGVLSVHSDQPDAFNEDDMPAIQSLADQVAIAIDNARLLRDLESANHELLHTKTFEAIATATGEAIHWVGNKAAPIPGSARRVREDVLTLVDAFQSLLALAPQERANHPLWPAWQALHESIPVEPALGSLQPFTLESILEDLAIIEQSARTILNVKEDLIGPARLQHMTQVDMPALLRKTIFEMGLPDGVVHTDFDSAITPVMGDDRQLGQLFNNLIKNAWEALAGLPNPKIDVVARQDDDPRYLRVDVADNGPGIPPDLLERIWVSFFTTKGDRGGTGLGLPACMSIVNQHQGKISLDSVVGTGTTFHVFLPVLLSK